MSTTTLAWIGLGLLAAWEFVAIGYDFGAGRPTASRYPFPLPLFGYAAEIAMAWVCIRVVTG